MKIKTADDMTTLTSSSRECRQNGTGLQLSAVLNLLGVVAGAAVALASIAAWGSALGFFAGVAGAFMCLDEVRQSW